MNNPIKDLPKGLLASVKALMEGSQLDAVEQIDELSKDTLVSYRNKAKEDPAFEKRRGKISATRKAIMAKRTKGIDTANNKIEAKNNAKWEEHNHVEQAVKEHIINNAHKVLAKHGFQKMADSDRHTTYARGNDSTGHVETVTIKKPHERDGKYSEISQFRSTNGWQSADDRFYNDNNHRWGGLMKKADINTHKKNGLQAYEKHIKDKMDYHNERGLKESVEVQEENTVNNKKSTRENENNKRIKLTKGWGDGGKSMKANYGKIANEEVTLSQEELDFLDQLNSEELDEARGRPARAIVNQGFTIHPKTKEKLMHTNPVHMARIEKLIKNGVLPKPNIEASQHIMQQLQKAKVSMSGTGKVNFHDGTTKDVHGKHAAILIDKYTSLKPHEKEAFQKKIQISHSNMMDELK